MSEPRDPIEFEKVCWVFGLTGGEMSISDEPWLGHAYHYDGAPDYAEADMKASAEEKGLDPWSLHTVIVAGGGYLSPPEETKVDAEGRTWTLIGSFTSSGETECPGRHDDVNRVRKEHCGSAARTDYEIDDPPSTPDRCVLCEAERGKEHGHIYIGEGYEAVYGTKAEEE